MGECSVIEIVIRSWYLNAAEWSNFSVIYCFLVLALPRWISTIPYKITLLRLHGVNPRVNTAGSFYLRACDQRIAIVMCHSCIVSLVNAQHLKSSSNCWGSHCKTTQSLLLSGIARNQQPPCPHNKIIAAHAPTGSQHSAVPILAPPPVEVAVGGLLVVLLPTLLVTPSPVELLVVLKVVAVVVREAGIPFENPYSPFDQRSVFVPKSFPEFGSNVW